MILRLSCFAQVFMIPDTVIKEKCYKSFYSKKIEGPSYVIYKLYKGGGSVSRSGMTFTSTLPHFNYVHSGYDKGHMVNAEDFAYDEKLEESTFRYYNALPQTPNLNRGKWKSNETAIRKESQTDSLLIVCGGCDFDNMIPARCFKVVYSMKTQKVLYSKIFTNTDAATERDCPTLMKKFTYQILYRLYKCR